MTDLASQTCLAMMSMFPSKKKKKYDVHVSQQKKKKKKKKREKSINLTHSKQMDSPRVIICSFG